MIVSAPGFGSRRRRVRVQQPVVHARAEFRVGYYMGCAPPPAEIAGTIRRNGEAGQLWVKAVPVNGVAGSETRVTEAGAFLIAGLEHAKYLVLVMKGDAVLHYLTVTAAANGPRLTIDLAAE